MLARTFIYALWEQAATALVDSDNAKARLIPRCSHILCDNKYQNILILVIYQDVRQNMKSLNSAKTYCQLVPHIKV